MSTASTSTTTITKTKTATTTATKDESDPTPHLTTLQTQGYVIVRSLLPPHLLLALQATSKYLTTKARSGHWKHIRSVPKQYPPWPTESHTPDSPLNIWGIQHLLHPSNLVRDTYAELYFSPTILSIVQELVGRPGTPASPDDLVMELLNLLVSPGANVDFSLQWHRDDIRPDISSAEESTQLDEKRPTGRYLHAQYNVALFDDSSLLVVPGSHARIRTDVEHAAGPYDVLPEQVVVALSPGDAVFYDSNILHRGVYKGIDPGKELGRMTLHGSVGLAGYGGVRARQVLQHGVGEWVGRDEGRFAALQGERGEVAEGMRRRLVEMGKGEGIGFSLEG